MELSVLPCGPIEANCYILADELTHNCVLIDPGEAAPVLDLVKAKGYTLKSILLTHGHFDHCMGVADILQQQKCDVMIHGDDEELINGSSGYISAMQYGLKPFAASRLLKDGDEIELDSIHLKVISTPGHTKGGVCYLDEKDKVIFTGDTLFCESIGRTDLHGGSMNALASSVLDTLFSLSEEYTAYPGHGQETSIAHEKKYNPLVVYAEYFHQENL